jgi:hypothetical protein
MKGIVAGKGSERCRRADPFRKGVLEGKLGQRTHGMQNRGEGSGEWSGIKGGLMAMVGIKLAGTTGADLEVLSQGI